MKFENLKLKNIMLAVRFMPKTDKWQAKNRKSHIFGIELGGISVHYFGDKKYTLEKNDILFFNKKDDYSVDVLEKGESLSVHFTTYEDIETDSFVIKGGGTPEMITLLERLVKENSSVGYDLKMSELFYRLCFLVEQARKKTYSKKDSRMTLVKDYLDRKYREKDCLEKASELSGVSRRRFNDLFKNSFGITPNRYIVKLKTEYAKQLLRVAELSVSEVSELCGFSDIYYFSKVFKSEYGISPSDYRKSF